MTLCLEREYQEKVIFLILAANCGVVIKSGSWYAYNSEKIGQGRENAKKYLLENPNIMEEIETKVRDFYALDGSEEKDADNNTETE